MSEAKRESHIGQPDSDVQRLLSLSNTEAHRLNHHMVGTDALLLAFVAALGDSEYRGPNVFKEIGLDPEKVKIEVEAATPPSDEPVSLLNRVFSPRARLAVQIAIVLARREGAVNTSPRHLFMGLLYGKGNYAGVVIQTLGLNVESAIETLRSLQSSELDPIQTSTNH